MTIEGLKFPIISFNGNDIYIARHSDEITICSKVALKNGFYRNLRIVDSEGYEVKVIDAYKIGTVGLFYGYNIFLNQKLKVELIFSNEKRITSLNVFLKKD